MRLISNEAENYGNTLVEQWLTAFYTGKNLEKLDPDGVLYRFHLSHNDLDGLACHVVSTVYDCALNRFEIPLVDLTDALQYQNWDEVHEAHHRMPILHSICKAGAKNVKEALHLIFEACCRSVFYKPVGPKDQIILLITDLGGITDSMFDEFYEAYGDRFQVIVIDHHLATTPDHGKCDPNQIFWYVTGYQEDNLQSATKNLFTATYGSYDAAHATSTASGRVSKKQETFVKQLTEYVDAVSKYDTGRWGEWLDKKTPDDVDLSVQHQLFFNRMAWDSCADVFHRIMISNYVRDMIYLLSMEDYVHKNLQYWEIVSNNLNELHKEFYDMHQLTLAYNPHVTLTVKIDPINGVYNPATKHMIRLGDISADVQLVNNRLHPLVTFGIIELSKDQGQTRNWKYFSLCSRELMKKYKLDLFILVDEPNGTVSLRSMNNHGFEINCADIARRNGGGGHKRAAGYPIPKADVPEDADTDTEKYDADDWEDDTEEVEDGGTKEADADDSSNDSEEEYSDEELIPDTYPPIGTRVHWAGYDWIVSHVDLQMLYLTLADIVPDWNITWYNLQDACTTFANKFTEVQKECLKSVTAGNTSGKVFVATKDQMDGEFSYFNSDDRRRANNWYWTSTESVPILAWGVDTAGSLGYINKSNSLGFRPSVCIELNLNIGNTVTFAGKQWVVSHKTADSLYLTLKGLSGKSTWYDLQNACTNFENSLTEAQKTCLKRVTAGNTSGKVFVATKDQMDGGFSYFNSNSHRRLNGVYWTSTEYSSDNAWSVCTDRSLDTTYAYFYHIAKSTSHGFRPSVCIDLTRHDSGDSKESNESKLNPELPDKNSLTLGNTVKFAGKQWIVSSMTTDAYYLTLNGVLGNSTWDNLQENCTNFANSLSEAQRRCLKHVTAGNTSGKVFVATYGQMNGGFSYFNSDNRRCVRSIYWTSTENSLQNAWGVRTDGSLNDGNVGKSYSLGFRPSIAIRAKELCNDHDISDELDGSEEEDSDEELHPIANRDRVLRWAGINWRPLQQDNDLLYLTPYEPTDDVKTCTYDEVDAVAAEWAVKHLSEFHRSLLIPIQINGKSYNVAPITLEHVLNIPDARNAKHAQICMPYGNVPYWTGSSAYNSADTDDMVWCMNEKGQNVPVNKDAFLAFRPMICLHIINVLDGNLDDGKPIVLAPNIQNVYPSVGTHVDWAENDWIVTHVDTNMVYMTLADVVPDWYVAWNDLQDACTSFADKFTEEERACLKNVTAGNTSGKVFVATYEQMDGDFSYFSSDNRRKADDWYWTSSEEDPNGAWSVFSDGSFGLDGRSYTGGFRPSVCVDLTLCDFGNIEGSNEYELNPELPDKDSLTVGNTVMFADQEWIVSHKTADTFYLTLKGLSGKSTWYDLQENCTNFANSLSEAQRKCLTYVTAGNTSGKVFVATKDQMDGGFSYFNSDSQRSVGSTYWTSTELSSIGAWRVCSDGSLSSLSATGYIQSVSFGFRPSVAIWTKGSVTTITPRLLVNDRQITIR